MNKLIFSVLAVMAVVCACSVRSDGSSEFVKVVDGQFVRGGDTLSFVGTNFWYGPLRKDVAGTGKGFTRSLMP